MNASEIIAEKFNGLVERYDRDGGLNSFSTAERAIWFLVTTRCEIDINSFNDVFIQSLWKDELEESIVYLRELGIDDIASLFEEAITLLETHGFYVQGDNKPRMRFHDLPQDVQNKIDAIGERVTENDILWDIDPKLCEMLNTQ
jgi:trans-2-enoyl-CoA reductase